MLTGPLFKYLSGGLAIALLIFIGLWKMEQRRAIGLSKSLTEERQGRKDDRKTYRDEQAEVKRKNIADVGTLPLRGLRGFLEGLMPDGGGAPGEATEAELAQRGRLACPVDDVAHDAALGYEVQVVHRCGLENRADRPLTGRRDGTRWKAGVGVGVVGVVGDVVDVRGRLGEQFADFDAALAVFGKF